MGQSQARAFTLIPLALAVFLLSGALRQYRTQAIDPDRLPRPRRPDIVLVTIDALRADHLSGYGYRRLTSPAIDRLAQRSTVFTRAFTQAPYTKAAIASLMSGVSPSAHKTVTATVPITVTMTGHLDAPPLSTDVLSDDITTLAERLRAAGYHTIGLTANPFLIAPFGFAQGFDAFEFFPGPEFATANHLVDAALTAVHDSPDEPVFLWLHFMEPHSPYTPSAWARDMFPMTGPPQPIPDGVPIPPWLLTGSPRDLRPYEIGYDSDIAAVDAAVDMLHRGFGELRDPANTVTVLTADHGEQFLDHGGFEHNDTLYDELIHIPLIVHVPWERASTVSAQVQLLDLYPTLTGFGGAEISDCVEGRDLRPLLSGASTSAPAYAEIFGVQTSIREDDWKLIRWTDGHEQLFDLRADPREQRDVSSTELERAAHLGAHLAAHAATANEESRRIRSQHAPVDPETAGRLRSLGYTAR